MLLSTSSLKWKLKEETHFWLQFPLSANGHVNPNNPRFVFYSGFLVSQEGNTKYLRIAIAKLLRNVLFQTECLCSEHSYLEEPLAVEWEGRAGSPSNIAPTARHRCTPHPPVSLLGMTAPVLFISGGPHLVTCHCYGRFCADLITVLLTMNACV